MATYTLKTAPDSKIEYDMIEVEETLPAPPAPKRIVTPGELKNKIIDIDERITSLQTEKSDIQAKLLLVQAEADKVLTAIKMVK